MAAVEISDMLANATEQVAVVGGVPIRRISGFTSYDFAERGVTHQFLEHASEYYERFTNPAHFLDLYRRAAAAAGLDGERRRRVLDIGTGGGNSVFAISALLPVDVVGVDISEPLLRMCAGAAPKHDMAGNLTLLCADLYDLDPVPESVDLVTGSSILHHMIDPAAIVSLALRALRPGGVAIFNEPFEAGHGILRTMYALLLDLDDGTRAPLAENVRAYLAAYIRDFDARCGIGNVRDYTKHLDDKWIFTRGWFETIAAEHGCGFRMMPTHSGRAIFSRQFACVLAMNTGADAAALPDWAQHIMARFDETYSAPQYAETPFTGIVIITKD